jgi:hypothetical protein
MVYYRNPVSKDYHPLSMGFMFLLVVLFTVCMWIVADRPTVVKTRYVNQEAVVHNHSSVFSADLFFEYVKQCGIRYPHIAMAQAVLESAEFKSNIFRIANNAFGMKVARSRPTTCNGEHSGHAYYDDWRLSVQDYALYQAAYLRKVRSEDEYYEFISNSYAGDPTYVEKVRRIAEKYK